MSEKDTNIVTADDLSFLTSIGASTNEEEVKSELEEDEVIQPKAEEIIEPQVQYSNDIIKDSIGLLIENNSWEDVSLKYEGEEYENISDLLNKVTVNENLFESLVKLQKDLKDTKLKTDYISLKDRDEVKVKLAKAILEGVEYEDLIRDQTELIDPVSNLDFSDEKVLEEFVRYGLHGLEGIPQKYLNAEIQELKNSYKLQEKAEEYRNLIKSNYEKEIETRTENLISERSRVETEKKENIKNLRKDLKDSNFSQTYIDKAVQLRYDIDESGEEHYITLIKNKMREDKNFQNDIIHQLLDKEDYISKLKAPIKQESTKKVLELINIVPKQKGSSPSKDSNSINLNEADVNFMNMITKEQK